MLVHCCLPSVAFAQLKRALPAPIRISSSADWDVLIAHVRRRSCDVAVVDPCIGGEHAAAHRLAELTAAVSATPGTPIVGYVSVTAGAIRATQLLARVDSSEIVIRGVDDTPDAFAATIHRAVAECSAIRFVARSRKLFERLPPGVARALAMAFHRPERARSVSQLASAANTTRRSLDRCLARAGLAPARTLLSCARANAAFHLIAAGSIRPSSAASLLGYASPRALSRELRALTGHVPSAIPEHLTHDLFAAALARRLFR